MTQPEHSSTRPERLERHLVDPDSQPPLPVAAAEGYADQVMRWSLEAPPPELQCVLDVPYGSHALQRYDVYSRPGMVNAPVLVFWHGGGWTNGYRRYAAFMAEHVTALGMLLVTPSYRLAPDHPLPAAHDDSMALLSQLQRDLPQWGGTVDRFYLSGHSAGGHLAALAALRRADRMQAGLPPDAVRACLPISGIMDLHHPEAVPGSLEARVYDTVLGGQPRTHDTLWSPLYWAAGNDVPFVLTWGERDSPRVCKSNERMAVMLRAQPGPVDTLVADGFDHFDTHLALRSPMAAWYGRLRARLSQDRPAT